ncbi:cytochrome C oxidase subunit IV family protein [Thermoactinomyces daqus]|jgi:cytochrome c oxidase subunit IV|uniref:Cytochrome C oxidase subunit IV family protein n=1 Tax=Thermoactinomyces daqus TaxID=1329516 RepID=A0A7W1X898_9BACL|nr:cytochrome C oxidase subunit IV family protein [Thermoactinomyces daqus]MBA4541871.1 cytochrome C oxidase subunit IV family protein [Thermoactinomyces daqus]
MQPDWVRQREPEKRVKRESPWKHVFSFVWMILFTAIAFWIVGENKLSLEQTFWIILILAILQVILQLFTFMHLAQRGYGIVILFFALGLLIAVISAVGIILM